MTGGGPRDVDLLVVSPRTTPGLQRDHDELIDALNRLGLSTAVATSDYGALGRLRGMAYVVDELIVVGALWHATRRVLKSVRPRGVLIMTSVAGLMLPSRLLARSGVRFDGLANITRTSWWAAPTRLLERRCLRRAGLLLPYTRAIATAAAPLIEADMPCIVWPSPVRPGPEPASERTPGALCYANDPEKKGLDLAVRAWTVAAPSSHRLFVAGIEPDRARRYLRARKVMIPANVELCGRLPEASYRKLSASVLIYLGSSRVDEFATTQLEALWDGALLVTGPSKGPIEALQLARDLDSRLVAEELTTEALAASVRQALALAPLQREAYRKRARELLEPYSRDAFTHRLHDQVLPALWRS